MRIFNKGETLKIVNSQREWILPQGISEWTKEDWEWFSLNHKEIPLSLKTGRIQVLDTLLDKKKLLTAKQKKELERKQKEEEERLKREQEAQEQVQENENKNN